MGASEAARVEEWITSTGCTIPYAFDVPCSSTPLSPLLVALALYNGEDWLETNCWYYEQPLFSGPPPPPHAGAEWKKALCFKGPDQSTLKTFVIDTSSTSGSLWREKISIRSDLAASTGNLGNSCIHLTDSQEGLSFSEDAKAAWSGFACYDSYECVCARALLEPSSLSFLNSEEMENLSLGSDAFRR